MLTCRITRETNAAGPAGARQRMLVFGGVESVPPPTPSTAKQSANTYEALVIDAEVAPGFSNLRIDMVAASPQDIRTWYGASNDPLAVHTEWLGEYPRLHQLTTGRIFQSGYGPRWSSLDHEVPGSWLLAGTGSGQPPGSYSSNWPHERHDGTSLLFPNLGGNSDVIVRLGGADGFNGPTTDTMESIVAGSPTSDWTAAPSIPSEFSTVDGGRLFSNTVILPTGGLLVLGGQWQDGSGATKSIYHPMLFENGQWQKLPANPVASRRTYHSTAVLLPDGRVFVGGGDDRDWDYEIFSPDYMALPVNRPQNLVWKAPVPTVNAQLDAPVLEYDNRYRITCDELPLGHAVAKVVLTAPCSTTHHSDMHQRYVELPTSVQFGTDVEFHTPSTDAQAPAGLYMLWLVTTAGSVSETTWVVLP